MLLPREQILEQVNVSRQVPKPATQDKKAFERIEGVLLVTNVRLLWKRAGDALYQVSENRLNVRAAQSKEATEANNFVLRVELSGKDPLHFRFSGVGARTAVEKVTALLNTRVSEPQARELSLSAESIGKMQLLGSDPHLRNLFDELVVAKKSVSEQEFWGSTLPAEPKSDELAQAGISNRPFLLMPRQNAVTQKTEFSLERADCQRLLKEFPALAASYEARVPLRCNEQEFWAEFLRKNFEYKTEIFGGNNPLFVPFATDAKHYEDVHVHNPKLLLAKGTDAAAVRQKAQLDVNFLENAQSLGLPEGYGSFQSRAEIDVLSAVTEQGLLDVARQQKKELEFEIQAKKVINKYNQTSTRIIQSNHVERKRDPKDLEELQ